MNYGYIYKTTNLVNNRVYIGQKKGKFTSKYLGSGIIIRKAINKEGNKKFKLEIIAYANNREDLNELEKKIIKEYREKLGKIGIYNIADGGQGGYVGDLAVEKMRQSHLGSHHSDETKNKMRVAATGRKLSEETKQKLSELKIKNPSQHKKECRCHFCRAKRGEFKGSGNPMFGVRRFGKESPNYRHGKKCKINIYNTVIDNGGNLTGGSTSSVQPADG